MDVLNDEGCASITDGIDCVQIFVEVVCLLYRFTLLKGQPGTDLRELTDEMLENQ